ncbi:hypothetical protein TNCV_2540531 [Trichonephila clavipes]|nr:hypothetical protein TNCV_2540531 [Trichonephila clavipes]
MRGSTLRHWLPPNPVPVLLPDGFVKIRTNSPLRCSIVILVQRNWKDKDDISDLEATKKLNGKGKNFM